MEEEDNKKELVATQKRKKEIEGGVKVGRDGMTLVRELEVKGKTIRGHELIDGPQCQ